MNITANIHHPARPKAQQLLQKLFVAPLARGVDNDDRLGRGKLDWHGSKYSGSVCGEERCVGDRIECGVVFGGEDGCWGDVDA